MVAFLSAIGGVTTATIAASGTIPIGTFWKDHETGFFKTTIQQGTFNATTNQLSLNGGNVRGTNFIKVTNATSGVVYVQGTDYTVNLNNGVVTRILAAAGGTIPAAATIDVWYTYSLTAAQVQLFGVGANYDRSPDDTQGSGKIAVVEGWGHIWTDQFDVTQTYALNDSLRSNAASLWTTATTAFSICGRVIHVPTASNPWLGVNQIPVAA